MLFAASKPTTPEAVRACFDAKEAKEAEKIRRKVEKKLTAFERRILIPALKKKGSIALRNRELKPLGLKLSEFHKGEAFESQNYLSLCLDTASWRTLNGMESAFVSLMEKYRNSGKFHVLGKYGKDGHVDRISVFTSSD